MGGPHTADSNGATPTFRLSPTDEFVSDIFLRRASSTLQVVPGPGDPGPIIIIPGSAIDIPNSADCPSAIDPLLLLLMVPVHPSALLSGTSGTPHRAAPCSTPASACFAPYFSGTRSER